MSSTKRVPGIPAAEADDWRAAGLRYFAYSHFLRRKFGGRVQRISVDAGFSCPNVDGSLGTAGCCFCDNRSFSPSRRAPRRQIAEQVEEAARHLRSRYKCERFLAYFQPSTNTYAPPERLRAVYGQALAHPQVVGLVVGTRPDCVPDEVLDLLGELASRTYVSVEYGLQSIHDRSLEWLGRGHSYAAAVDAVQRSRGRGFHIGAHLILGIPGETAEDLQRTAEEVARLRLDSVKLHNLYVVQNTRLAGQFAAGEVVLCERAEYVRHVVDFLEQIPPTTVVERLSGDAPPEFLVAPTWCLDKPALRAAVVAEFERRGTWQGKRQQHEPPGACATCCGDR